MSENERIPHPGEMEMCLCGRCASVYYNMKDHRIKRVDMLQVEKDVCTIDGTDDCAISAGSNLFEVEFSADGENSEKFIEK